MIDKNYAAARDCLKYLDQTITDQFFGDKEEETESQIRAPPLMNSNDYME